MTLTLIQGWHTRQLDFVLTYLQAEVEGKLPKGFRLSVVCSHTTHVLKLSKNIYWLQQAGRVWNIHLDKVLVRWGYQQSNVYPCLYFCKNILQAIYIDDCILAAKQEKELKKPVNELAAEFEITDEGEMDEYLGVKIEKRKDGMVMLYQPYLISQI